MSTATPCCRMSSRTKHTVWQYGIKPDPGGVRRRWPYTHFAGAARISGSQRRDGAAARYAARVRSHVHAAVTPRFVARRIGWTRHRLAWFQRAGTRQRRPPGIPTGMKTSRMGQCARVYPPPELWSTAMMGLCRATHPQAGLVVAAVEVISDLHPTAPAASVSKRAGEAATRMWEGPALVGRAPTRWP